MNSILYSAELCVAAYSDVPAIPHKDIKGFVEIRDTATGADGFVFVSRQSRTLHIVFRGSESILTSDGRVDWLHNFMVRKDRWAGIKAHRGAVRCARAVMGRVNEVINAFPGFAITLQGHSAGGNIATLVALALCHKFTPEDGQQLRLITFGQSRLAKGSDLEHGIWCDYVRVQNGSDAVCRWPKIGYSHAGRNLYYPNSSGTMGDYVWNPSPINQCRDIALTSIGRVLDHRMSEYAARTFRAVVSDAAEN